MNLFDAIFRHRRQSPAISATACTTYDDLQEDTLSMAWAIARTGIEREIAALFNGSLEFVEAFIAICSMANVVLINTPKPLDQRQLFCRARLILLKKIDLLWTDVPEFLPKT